MTILDAYPIQHWFFIILASVVIGLSKSGIKGIDMLNVTLMAIVFGSKASTGVILPLLCLGDILSVLYYKRNVQWQHFWKLLPWMAIGILIGVFIGQDLDEIIFKKIMAGIIILTVFILVGMEKSKDFKIPNGNAFAIIMGLICGFVTMIGNLAGAFSNIYFLAFKMSKKDFIGTAAMVFLIINLFKLPLQFFFWKNINSQSLLIDVLMIPFIILGFLLGIKIVKKINEDNFRRMIFILTSLGAILILIK